MSCPNCLYKVSMGLEPHPTVYCIMYLILCHLLVVDSERSTQSEAAVGWIAVRVVVEPKGSLC